MNRRDFLRMLGIGAAAAVAPKFIFDVGANLYKQEHVVWFETPLPDDWMDRHFDLHVSLFKQVYGNYAENVYAKGNPLMSLIPGDFVSVGKEVVVPISFGYDPSNS